MFRLFLVRQRVPTLYVSDYKQQSYGSLKVARPCLISAIGACHKRTICTSSSRKSMSAFVSLAAKQETRPWYSPSQYPKLLPRQQFSDS